jgi:predicted amidohydrolase
MSSAVLSKQNIDVLLDGDESLRGIITEGGGCTMILDPEGRELVEKPDGTIETLVYADVDLSLCEMARVSVDLNLRPLPLSRTHSRLYRFSSPSF